MRTDFLTGVVWNIAALLFLAVLGVALNIAIGRLYGPADLGTFNIAFTLLICISQIASFGLQLSVLHGIAKAGENNPEQLAAVIYGGLALCVVIASLVTLLSILGTDVLTHFFPGVPDLKTAWLIAAPGLLPFAANKYLLGAVNGLQHMRAFAVFQAARFVLILIALGIMVAIGAPGPWLAGILSAAEFALCIPLGLYVLRAVPCRGGLAQLAPAAKRHASFGLRVFAAGLLTELNKRVDVLLVGALMNARAAGIYTVAALLFEAGIQVIFVIRNNLNPRLARNIEGGRVDEILRMSRLTFIALTPLLALGAIVAYFGFPIAVRLILDNPEFLLAREPLLWLMLALPAAGAALCFSLILSLGGYPTWQTILTLLILGVTCAFNAVLIPLYGIAGAGLAMAISTIIAAILSVVIPRYVMGIRLFV